MTLAIWKFLIFILKRVPYFKTMLKELKCKKIKSQGLTRQKGAKREVKAAKSVRTRYVIKYKIMLV